MKGKSMKWWSDFVEFIGKDFLIGLAIRFVVTFVVAFLVFTSLMGWWW